MTPEQIRLDVQFIIEAAPRIAKLAGMTVMSCGLTYAARDVVKRASSDIEERDDWFQALLGYRNGMDMITVVRIALLLDSDSRNVSFQAIYRRLKVDAVKEALIAEVHGLDNPSDGMFGPTPPTDCGCALGSLPVNRLGSVR